MWTDEEHQESVNDSIKFWQERFFAAMEVQGKFRERALMDFDLEKIFNEQDEETVVQLVIDNRALIEERQRLYEDIAKLHEAAEEKEKELQRFRQWIMPTHSGWMNKKETLLRLKFPGSPIKRCDYCEKPFIKSKDTDRFCPKNKKCHDNFWNKKIRTPDEVAEDLEATLKFEWEGFL